MMVWPSGGVPREQFEGSMQSHVRTGLNEAETHELALVLHFFSQNKPEVQPRLKE